MSRPQRQAKRQAAERISEQSLSLQDKDEDHKELLQSEREQQRKRFDKAKKRPRAGSTQKTIEEPVEEPAGYDPSRTTHLSSSDSCPPSVIQQLLLLHGNSEMIRNLRAASVNLQTTIDDSHELYIDHTRHRWRWPPSIKLRRHRAKLRREWTPSRPDCRRAAGGTLRP